MRKIRNFGRRKSCLLRARVFILGMVDIFHILTRQKHLIGSFEIEPERVYDRDGRKENRLTDLMNFMHMRRYSCVIIQTLIRVVY